MAAPRITGRYESTSAGGEEVQAFVPYPLPPEKPPLVLDDAALKQLHQAESALARLELAGDLVPSLPWFIYAFVRKEAVLSSRIEGTQASLADLLSFEAEESPNAEPNADVEEICNYLDALNFAREQLEHPGGLPLSMRLIGEVHRRLMSGVRGSNKSPGEVRRTQNWIGGTRPGNAAFVPPPPQRVELCLSELEGYLHSEDKLHPLIRTALIHAQFETIHPYLDGNGRTGRMLITLALEHWGLLREPLLYLSLFIHRHRAEYYARLNAVREGDWESWIDFFLEGVVTIANEAVTTARDLFTLVSADRTRLLEASASSVNSLRLLESLPEHPIVTTSRVVSLTDTTKPTASKAIQVLVDLGILVETSGRQRDRSFRYRDYLELLSADDTE